jgi:streptogramin lyase
MSAAVYNVPLPLVRTLTTFACASLLLAAAPSHRPSAIEYGAKSDRIGAVLLPGLDAQNTPDAVAVTSDGAVWFRETFAWHPRIARIGPEGRFEEFWNPLQDYRPGHYDGSETPGSFAADGDGVVIGPIENGGIRRMGPHGDVSWRDAHGCISADASFACFDDPGNAVTPDLGGPQGADVKSVARGPDGALWVTETWRGVIIRFDRHGGRREFRHGLTKFNSGPQFITAGYDGALWFTEARDRVGRITIGGVITEYGRGIPHRSSMGGIIAGRDGAMWFTLFHGMVLARITGDGVVTQFHDLVYPSDGHDFDPVAMIVSDRAGRLYYNEGQAGRVVRATLRT